MTCTDSPVNDSQFQRFTSLALRRAAFLFGGLLCFGFLASVASAQNSNANLANLVLSAGALNPAFNVNTTSYTVSVPNSITSTTVTPTVQDPSATITVNGNPVPSGTASGSIPLNVGRSEEHTS